ncbi:MAG TPA: hypothetical protein VHY22_12170 [Chthoniobacteraceae bacterium]|nr:hypothetical protein [Chthoniobacteraceae bacterium]
MSVWEYLEERVSAAIASAEPAAFDALALPVFQFQREHNLPYAQYCRSLGTPAQPADWRAIPAVPQAAFKHAALRAFPEAEETARFLTSGTTGEGRGVHHFRSMRLYDEAILRGWDLLEMPALPHILLIPSPGEAPHSSLSHMMGVLRARAAGGGQSWCVHPDTGLDVPRLRELMNGFIDARQPVLLLGTALAFLHWFEAPGAPLALPAGSMAFETGGYKGAGRSLTKSGLYHQFHRRLGLDADCIVNEYGMTELSSQCYTRGLGSTHAAPPWMRVLVVDPATGCEVADGETGLLRIYDLANLGSVMGIQTRDMAIRRGGDFELLGRDPAALPRGCSRAADEMLTS